MKKLSCFVFIVCLLWPALHVPAQSKSEFNVMDFGADNTGREDCSAAFSKLLASLDSQRQVCVLLPAGKYRISKRVEFDGTNFSPSNSNCGLTFKGDGEDVSELLCDNDEGGFLFNVKTNVLTVTVENMSFVTQREGRGTAIEFNTGDANPGDHHSRMFQVRNVLIRGTHYDKGFFDYGVKCFNAWYPMLENVKLTGRYGPGSDTCKMKTGFLFQDCYSPLVANCYFWGNAEKGLAYVADKIQPEDGIVKESYFVGQDNGVYVDIKSAPDWSEPAFHLTNCHINYASNGLFLKGMRQVFVTGNLFYCHNEGGSRWKHLGTPVTETTSTDVNLVYASDVIISGNQFTEPASPRRIAIDISEKSANILIKGNIFNFDGTGIRNRSTKTSYCFDNVWNGEPSFSVGFKRIQDETGKLKLNK
jgi:hypothetical protein